MVIFSFFIGWLVDCYGNCLVLWYVMLFMVGGLVLVILFVVLGFVVKYGFVVVFFLVGMILVMFKLFINYVFEFLVVVDYVCYVSMLGFCFLVLILFLLFFVGWVIELFGYVLVFCVFMGIVLFGFF